MSEFRKDGSRNYRCGASWASYTERAAWQQEDTLDPQARLLAQRRIRAFVLDDAARFALAQERRAKNGMRMARQRKRARGA